MQRHIYIYVFRSSLGFQYVIIIFNLYIYILLGPRHHPSGTCTTHWEAICAGGNHEQHCKKKSAIIKHISTTVYKRFEPPSQHHPNAKFNAGPLLGPVAVAYDLSFQFLYQWWFLRRMIVAQVGKQSMSQDLLTTTMWSSPPPFRRAKLAHLRPMRQSHTHTGGIWGISIYIYILI